MPLPPQRETLGKGLLFLEGLRGEALGRPTHDQDRPDRNPGPQVGGPVFPDPEHQLNMIYGGSDAYESKRK